MTLNELITLVGHYPWWLLVAFGVPPLAVLGIGLTHGPGQGESSPRCYFYAALIYLTCLPGLFALTLTAYSLLFTRQNLLDVNLLVYALPVVSMAFTLGLMARQVNFEKIPGFDRLSGLIVVLVVTFAALFLLSRTRIWLLFGGSFLWLIALGVAIFFILKLGVKMLVRGQK